MCSVLPDNSHLNVYCDVVLLFTNTDVFCQRHYDNMSYSSRINMLVNINLETATIIEF